jgi:hypothetical protein|tara:strand:+ start:3885 stop:4577 length:693 start_codon:yes stop_codon:yes gene_type:complete
MTTSTSNNKNNVIDIFTQKPYSSSFNQRIIRLAPELDGLEMIYSNETNPEKLFNTKILCWALRANGEVIGLTPWLDKIAPCPLINDPVDGRWEGYFDPSSDEVFHDAPIHKIIELETAAEYYEKDFQDDGDIVQEIPDMIGTHAVLLSDGFKHLTLKEVVSWRLLSSGAIECMLIDDAKVVNTPVLPGDDCLYSCKTEEAFRYFFQHHIANKIKARDPEALEAIAMLVDC